MNASVGFPTLQEVPVERNLVPKTDTKLLKSEHLEVYGGFVWYGDYRKRKRQTDYPLKQNRDQPNVEYQR